MNGWEKFYGNIKKHKVHDSFFTLYLLESIFLRGLFTNPLIALVNIIVAIIAMVIAFIKKEKKLAIIDLSILIVVSAILTYLMNL